VAVRTVSSAVAVLAVAAAVLVVVSRERRLRREAASCRLMAGCAHRDNAALWEQLEVFRQRVRTAAADDGPATESLSVSTPIDPTVGGGPA
jgi:hypothetical protein